MRHVFEIWVTFETGDDDPTDWMEDVAGYVRNSVPIWPTPATAQPVGVECVDAWPADGPPSPRSGQP